MSTKGAPQGVLDEACRSLGLVEPRPKEGVARWVAKGRDQARTIVDVAQGDERGLSGRRNGQTEAWT